MANTWMLKAGADLAYDGEACTVIEVCDGAIITRTRDGRLRRLRLLDVLRPRSEGGLAHIPGRTRAEEEAIPLGVIWDDATDASQRKPPNSARGTVPLRDGSHDTRRPVRSA